jgi:hypothetical protein
MWERARLAMEVAGKEVEEHGNEAEEQGRVHDFVGGGDV